MLYEVITVGVRVIGALLRHGGQIGTSLAARRRFAGIAYTAGPGLIGALMVGAGTARVITSYSIHYTKLYESLI